MRRRPPERTGTALALGIALALTALPAPAGAQSELSELQTVERIRFEGRHQVSEKELRLSLKTRLPSILPWRERPVLRLDFLRADTLAIATVYRQHGLLDASAGVEIKPLTKPAGSAEIIYHIVEGERSTVRSIEFTGVHAVPESQLRQKIYTKRGKPFNPLALIVDTLRIAEVYQDRGYRPRISAAAKRGGNDVAVRYDVEEGPIYHFGEVYYSSAGPLGVKRSVIESMLEVHKGDLYRNSRIQRSIEHLYSTDLFRSVQVTPLPDSTNSLMEISMRLEERKKRWIDAGIGSGTSERFNIIASWGHRNLNGKGLAGILGSRLSLDQNGKFLLWRTELTARAPLLFGIRATPQVTGYYLESDDRDEPLHRWVIHQTGPGVRFQVEREFSRILKLSLTQDNYFVQQTVTLLAPQVSDTLVPAYYTTHLVNAQLVRDVRDDPLLTTRGSAQSIRGEVAGGVLTGTTNYVKSEFASAWYTPFHVNWVLALQFRAGAATPFGGSVQFTPEDSTVSLDVSKVPLANRFRLGGVNSVRGFAENALAPNGGLAMLQGNLEVRIPLNGPFGLEFFVDGGNVWESADDIKWRDLKPYVGPKPVAPGDLRYVFGFGPRLNLPFGPLRLDLTWSPRPIDPITKQWFVHEVQFAIGPTF